MLTTIGEGAEEHREMNAVREGRYTEEEEEEEGLLIGKDGEAEEDEGVEESEEEDDEEGEEDRDSEGEEEEEEGIVAIIPVAVLCAVAATVTLTLTLLTFRLVLVVLLTLFVLLVFGFAANLLNDVSSLSPPFATLSGGPAVRMSDIDLFCTGSALSECKFPPLSSSSTAFLSLSSASLSCSLF